MDKEHTHDSASKEEKTATKKSVSLQDFTKKQVAIPTAIVAVLVVAFLLLFSNGWIVAATVNGAPVYRHQVRNMTETELGADTLRSLVSKKLIDQEIRSAGVVVSKEDIDQEIQEIDDLLMELQETDFASTIEARGLTMSEARDQIRQQLELEALFADSIAVTEEEVDAMLADSGIELPEDEAELNLLRESARDQLTQQRLYEAYTEKERELREAGNIHFFVDYLTSKS